MTSPGEGPGRTVFVTGASGLVGQRAVALLAGRGDRVVALVRTAAAADAAAEAGAAPLLGDLDRPAGWSDAARDADLVVHLAVPRLVPPARSRRLWAMARSAASWAAAVRAAAGPGRPVVAAATGLPGGALAAVAGAAEEGLADPELRVVRLGWVYGASGLMCDIVHGLAQRRFRVVGPGTNAWALVSARDAAAALLLAADGPPGASAAYEDDPAPQEEVVRVACRGVGAPFPDRVPPRMAGFAMGGAVARALAAPMAPQGPTPPGWRPADSWRDALVARAYGDDGGP